jgi:hypothetical protein
MRCRTCRASVSLAASDSCVDMAHRALLRQLNALLSPRDFGRSASCDTSTLSMKIDPVSDTRSAALFFIAGAESPFMPCTQCHSAVAWRGHVPTDLLENEPAHFSVPLAPRPDDEHIPATNLSEAALQHSRRTYATGALEIQVFEPDRTKPPSLSVAVVSIPAGSEPWLGSVSPCDELCESADKSSRVTDKAPDQLALCQARHCANTMSVWLLYVRHRRRLTELLLLRVAAKLVDGVHDQRGLNGGHRTIARVDSMGAALSWRFEWVTLD